MGTVRRDPSLADNALLPGEAWPPGSSAEHSAEQSFESSWVWGAESAAKWSSTALLEPMPAHGTVTLHHRRVPLQPQQFAQPASQLVYMITSGPCCRRVL